MTTDETTGSTREGKGLKPASKQIVSKTTQLSTDGTKEREGGRATDADTDGGGERRTGEEARGRDGERGGQLSV